MQVPIWITCWQVSSARESPEEAQLSDPRENPPAGLVFLAGPCAQGPVLDVLEARAVMGGEVHGACAVTVEAGLLGAIRRDPEGRARGQLVEIASPEAVLEPLVAALGLSWQVVEVWPEAGAPVRARTPWCAAAETAGTGAVAAGVEVEVTAGVVAAFKAEMALPAERRTGFGSVLRRALARQAAQGTAHDRPGSPERPHLRGAVRERVHGGFFAVEKQRYSHRRFDGGWSGEVEREVFLTGDAVVVLPWDPVRGKLLLIRQIRAGMVARGDADPFSLETVAGLRDRAEPPEETARREAMEEAGITLSKLAPLAEYYPSPGALTEYIHCYVGLADLGGYAPGHHGLEAEGEDIETLLMSEEDALAAVAAGEIRNGPLILALLALERNRAAILRDWGLALAALRKDT